MILVVIDRRDIDQWVVLSDFLQLGCKVGKNSLVEYFLAIFAHQNDMVFAMIYTVTQPLILHTFSMGQADAGDNFIPGLNARGFAWEA